MCKSEIFAKIIALVSKGTEIPTELIVSDNRVTEIVNARYILVYILYEKGFYPSQISSLIHKTKRSVNYMISNCIYFIRMLTRLSNTVRWSAFPLPSRNILWHPLWDSCPKWKWLWMLLSASTGRTRHSKIFLPAWI